MTSVQPEADKSAHQTTNGSTHPEVTTERIAQIVDNRARKRPQIQRQIARWEKVQQSLERLPAGLQELVSTDGSHAANVNALLNAHSTLLNGVLETQQNLDVARRRFDRETVNIGVSGRARTGKSTVLRSISGLGEAQIPTGDFIPTTAVRSLIFHQAEDPHADIQFHTYESFRDSTLEKYHSELELSPTPQTLSDFRAYSYPSDVQKFAKSRARVYDAEAMVLRLKAMQRALPSYADLLAGERKKLPLEELRPYVAYPTQEEKDAGRVERKYLAVKECNIYTPFEHGGVEHLGIVDLPGLGEVDPKAESRMVEGLQNDADIVLFLLRDEDSDLSIGKKETDAMTVIDQARKPIKNSEDYVFITLNISTKDPKRIGALRAEVHEKLSRHRILECNAANPESVANDVLMPVLEHLVDKLPAMDRDVWEAAVSGAGEIEKDLHDFAQRVDRLARGLQRQSDHRKRLDTIAKDLGIELSKQCDAIVRSSLQSGSDKDFCNAVDTIDKGVKDYVKNGFHLGDTKVWLKMAEDSIIDNVGWGDLENMTRNNLRVYVSRAFQKLDDFFKGCVAGLREEVGDALESYFGEVVQPESNENRLQAFVRACGTQYPTLKNAVLAVDELEITYNSHLYPWVRENLGYLEPRAYEPGSVDGQRTLHGVRKDAKAHSGRKTNQERAQEIYAEFQKSAESVSANISKALKEKEGQTGVRVLWAAAAKFDDEFRHSPTSNEELRDFVEQYADKMYPDEFGKAKAVQNVVEQRLLPATLALQDALTGS